MTSIIILTYNQLEYTKLCIESIYSNTNNIQLVVVDNNSTDGTVEWLMKEMNGRNSHEIFNNKNRGFPVANNQGLTKVEGEYICLLNNDTIVTPQWLDRLIVHLENGFDIVGPCSNYVNGIQKVIIDIYNNKEELNIYSQKYYEKNEGICEEVNWIIGYCMLIKKEVIDDIGLFDEQYGIGNWEDVDFCTKAKEKGYKVGIARDVYIHHFGSKTWYGQPELNYGKVLEENNEKFINKWGFFPEQKIND